MGARKVDISTLKNDEIFNVKIPNWDKYQAEVASGRRAYIKVNVDMPEDPAVDSLGSASFRAWVHLLLHAGKVGVPFKFSKSMCRVKCKLQQISHFMPLIDHGLITIHRASSQYKRGEDRIVKNNTALADGFDQFWEVYPRKNNKQAALLKWQSKKCHTIADQIIADVKNRIANHNGWQEAEFIPHASTYLNNARWDDPIEPIRAKARRIPTDDQELLKLCKELGIGTRGKSYKQLHTEIRDKWSD